MTNINRIENFYSTVVSSEKKLHYTFKDPSEVFKTATILTKSFPISTKKRYIWRFKQHFQNISYLLKTKWRYQGITVEQYTVESTSNLNTSDFDVERLWRMSVGHQVDPCSVTNGPHVSGLEMKTIK